MARVYLSLGSNQQRQQHLCAALDALSDHFGELMISPVYQGAPEDSVARSDDEPNVEDYFNVVVGFDTDLAIEDLIQWNRALEARQGRQRLPGKRHQVSLDIDLLLYDELCLDENGVCLPRADILKCAYVLRPLADIAGDLCHPQLGKSYQQLWQAFPNDHPLTPVDFIWRDQVISAAHCDVHL